MACHCEAVARTGCGNPFLQNEKIPTVKKGVKYIMELRHVLGGTYVAVGATALLPLYKLNDTDVVLLDTGYAKLDRSGLTHLLEDNRFQLKGILSTMLIMICGI